MKIVILKRDSAPGSSRPKTLLTGFLKMAPLQVCPLDPTKTVSRGQVINFDISTILGQIIVESHWTQPRLWNVAKSSTLISWLDWVKVIVESPLDPTKTVSRGQVQ